MATFAAGLGSLIEVVNRFGSFFYGSLLGVFVLALVFRRANGHGAFVGLLAGIASVATFALHPATSGISFLWQNPLGVVVVVIVGLAVSAVDRRPQPAASRALIPRRRAAVYQTMMRRAGDRRPGLRSCRASGPAAQPAPRYDLADRRRAGRRRLRRADAARRRRDQGRPHRGDRRVSGGDARAR